MTKKIEFTKRQKILFLIFALLFIAAGLFLVIYSSRQGIKYKL